MKKTVLVASGALVALGFAASDVASAAGKQYKFDVIVHDGTTSFYAPVINGMNIACAQIGAECKFLGPPNGSTGFPSDYTFAVTRFISGPMAAIEFYNPALNHYFMSMDPLEVADLDLGTFPGWIRTSLSFLTYGSAASATGTLANPVCRFYIPPQHGNSHFLSADPVECALAREKTATDPNFSGYVEETPNAFYIDLPDKATGECPASTTPVYRLWNQRPDSNHRYTTSVAIKDQMIANGWFAEGYGPNAVDMCAPQ